MTALIRDRGLERALIRRRRRLGLDRYDEVWEGVYVMSPPPRSSHQRIAGWLDMILRQVVECTGRGLVLPVIGISDRHQGWKQNYRVPETAVFLNGTAARNYETHWVGGPDFCVEIASPGEKVEDKLPFYASIGTREVLLVLRSPQRLRLMTLINGELVVAGESSHTRSDWVSSNVVPLSFCMADNEHWQTFQVRRTDEPGSWVIPLS